MDENRPQWVEPSQDNESRLAIDLLPGERKHSRLWVFVHGFVSHRRGEKALFFREQLQARGEAFASLDLAGHGDSDGDLFGLTMSRNLSDLDRGLRFAQKELGPFSSINLVGSSMGGFAAIWYSALNPGMIKKNLLIAPAFEMAGRLILSLGPSKAERWRKERKIHLEAEFATFDLGYEFVEDESHYLIPDLVKRLQTPTLILHGSNDESVPCQLSRSFAARVDLAELVEIEGGDHRLTDHKDRLFKEMWKFAGPPEWLFSKNSRIQESCF